MGSRPRFRGSADGQYYLTDRERRHFCFGAITKDLLLAKLSPIVRAAAREGIRKPADVSRLLNGENIATATGDRWTPRLAWCLLRLVFENKADPAASLWNLKPFPINGEARRNNPTDLPRRTPPQKKRRRQAQPRKSQVPRNSSPPKLQSEATRKNTQTPGPSLVDRTIRKLPSMPTDTTIRVRHNALRQLIGCDDPSFRAQMKRLIDAIAKDWLRRQLETDDADGYFKWPSTDAPGGDGSVLSGDWPTEGLLFMMQYSVGRQSDLSPALRCEILAHIFEQNLPPLISPEYMRAWGLPGSPMRLQKMANSIAAFTRNAKRRRDASMTNAIGEWEVDLRLLYDRYYVVRFGFGWPTTSL